MKLSVGIGLTNDCNLACEHCYRDTERIDNISLDQIKTICEYLPVGSMGFGTGENAFNPEFVSIIEYLHTRSVQLSVASNGYTLMALSDDHLRMFHDVEVSIDFATREAQDAFRGEGNWALVHAAMKRCHTLGVTASVLATMMSINYDQIDRLAVLARTNNANLRVNAYQSVKTDRFKLTYDQFWNGYRRLFSAAQVISCAEPVVRAAMGLDNVDSPCARTSIRFNPRGQIIPCVYWRIDGGRALTVSDLPRLGVQVMDAADFERAREVPSRAADCACRGGCAARRALNGNLDRHDEYCPWARGEDIWLRWEAAPSIDLMRARNVCTTIVV